jgi:epoxide hydrolase-like predicted phosphatase
MKDKKEIKAVIFDLGGVIMDIDHLETITRATGRKFKKPWKKALAVTLDRWKKARINPKHDGAFWRDIAHALQITEAQLQREFRMIPKQFPEVIRLVRKLQKRYVIGMMSNQIESWHHMLMDRWNLAPLFNPIVTSYATRSAKPDPKIYKHLLRKLKLVPHTCLYIDDREPNLIPAQRLGMHTIHFKNPKQLIRDLKKHGVH